MNPSSVLCSLVRLLFWADFGKRQFQKQRTCDGRYSSHVGLRTEGGQITQNVRISICRVPKRVPQRREPTAAGRYLRRQLSATGQVQLPQGPRLVPEYELVILNVLQH